MLLTLELLPLVLDTATACGEGRIIIVSSYGHTLAPPYDFSRLNPTEDEYQRLQAYYNSKLCNVCMHACTIQESHDVHVTCRC